MSVLAKDRKLSQLRVLTNWTEVRLAFQRLFTFNFGYDHKYVENAVRREYQVYESTDEMKPARLEKFKALVILYDRETQDILYRTRKYMKTAFITVEEHLFIANTIYPTSPEELSLRRCHQDEAAGIVYAMMKELEFIMRAVPVNTDKYPIYIQMLADELALIKAWRASNNKFNKTVEKSKAGRDKVQTTNPNAMRFTVAASVGNLINSTPEGQLPNSEQIDAIVSASRAESGATKRQRGGSRTKPSYSKGQSYSTGYRLPPEKR